MGLIEEWFGQDDEEFWAGLPIVGPARQAVIDIPDQFWNDIPVVGPLRQTALAVEDITSIPAWVLTAGVTVLAALVLWKVVR